MKTKNYRNKRNLLGFVLEYGIQILLIFFIANISIFEITRFFILGQSCMNDQQIQSDSRCLYIYGSNVYEKGTRSSPHHGHPCGSNVTTLLPSSHRNNMVQYLDPNLIAPYCPNSASTPTPTPTSTPSPTSSPTPTPTSTPSPTHSNTPTPSPTHNPTTTPSQNLTATPSQNPIATYTPTQAASSYTPTMESSQNSQILTPTVGATNQTTPPPTTAYTYLGLLLRSTPQPNRNQSQPPTAQPSVVGQFNSAKANFAVQNNLELISQISADLAALSLAGVLVLIILQTPPGKRLLGLFVSILNKRKREQAPDLSVVKNKIFYIKPLTKEQSGDETWVLLVQADDNKKQSLGYCEFPWKIEGLVKISGRWEKKNGKEYIRIDSVRLAE